MAKQAR